MADAVYCKCPSRLAKSNLEEHLIKAGIQLGDGAIAWTSDGMFVGVFVNAIHERVAYAIGSDRFIRNSPAHVAVPYKTLVEALTVK